MGEISRLGSVITIQALRLMEWNFDHIKGNPIKLLCRRYGSCKKAMLIAFSAIKRGTSCVAALQWFKLICNAFRPIGMKTDSPSVVSLTLGYEAGSETDE
jgi:hypothetical protein